MSTRTQSFMKRFKTEKCELGRPQARTPTSRPQLTTRTPAHQKLTLKPLADYEARCLNHPLKDALFEPKNSLSEAYCQQCSLKLVQHNVRMVRLTEESLHLRSLFEQEMAKIDAYQKHMAEILGRYFHLQREALGKACLTAKQNKDRYVNLPEFRVPKFELDRLTEKLKELMGFISIKTVEIVNPHTESPSKNVGETSRPASSLLNYASLEDSHSNQQNSSAIAKSKKKDLYQGGCPDFMPTMNVDTVCLINIFICNQISPLFLINLSSMESTRYLNHPLNKSTAKATFSFSRSQRLPKTNKILNHSFYDLPSMRSQRACSLGVGNKSNLVNKAASPPPGTYDPKLGFNQANKSSMIGFGKGRAEVTFGNFLNDSIRAKNLPAPNRYRVNFSTFSKRCGLISERIKNDTEMSQAKQLPGPGTYSPTKIDIKDTGSFLVSKYKNFGSPRYHNPQQQTPKRHRTESELGPLSYNTNHISFVNRSVLSKFKNSGGSSFPRSERSGLIDKSKLETPGFVYATYSQFGTAQ